MSKKQHRGTVTEARSARPRSPFYLKQLEPSDRGKDWYKWSIRVTKKGSDSRKKKHETYHGTKGQAERYAMALWARFNDQPLDEPSKDTLEALWNRYLEARAKQLRPNTLYKYDCQFRNYVPEHLKAKKVSKVIRTDLQGLLDELHKEGKSLDTVRNTKAVLGGLYSWATRQGYIAMNPCSRLELPKQTVPKRPRCFTREQLREARAAWRDSKFALVFDVLVGTGLRLSELQGLYWDALDLDSDPATLDVRLSASFVKGVWHEGLPKTLSSRRRIGIPNELASRLRAIRKDKALLVFCDKHGQRLSNSTLSKELNRCLDEVGLPRVGLHGLRHTAATLLFEEHEDLKNVSDHLGHSSIKTTLDIYTHVHPAARVRVGTALSVAFTG
jgi:site-specific recombinase XerC